DAARARSQEADPAAARRADQERAGRAPVRAVGVYDETREPLKRLMRGAARPSPQGRHVELIGRADAEHGLVGRAALDDDRRVSDVAGEPRVFEEDMARPSRVPLVARLRSGTDRTNAPAGV